MNKIASSLKFRVSAPGKVILHGEHSVVHGKPALAGVIGARNYFYIKDCPSTTNVEIRFEALELQTDIATEDINKLMNDLRSSNSTDFTSAIGVVSDYVNKNYSHLAQDDDRKSNSLKAFLYLLCGVFNDKNVLSLKNGFETKLKSVLNIGAGLGSSASFGVCLAAAFLILARKHSDEEFLNINEISINDKQFISKWAFMSEKLMHGTPSGVDNTVCTFGNIVKFTKGQEPSQISLKSKLPILLVDTKVPRSTAKLVANVKELKNTFPEIMNKILDGMEEVVKEAIPLYESFVPENGENYKKIEQLFAINNNLLRAIGVSHLRLEKIFEIANKNEFSSKLTGAGGGGFALILLPPDYLQKENFKALCNELNENGFDYTETNIGGPGVQVEEEN